MTLHRGSHRSNPPYHSPLRAMNHYQTASTSQVPLSADLPDLYYEQGYRTPSVTSSDVLSTPPRHSQTPWMEYHNDVRENNVSYMSSWQSSPMDSCQSKRPTVAPIDTNFNWGLYDISPMSYTSDDFNRVNQVADGHRSIHSHPFVDNNPTMDFSSSSMPDSSSDALLPSLSISDPSTSPSPIDPNTSSPHINQPPLKLHQPRPSRRIPIISLSNLASACDDIANQVQEPKRHASEEAPFPLSLDFNRISSMLSLPAVDGGNTHHLKYMLYPTSNVYSPTYGVGYDGHSGKAILCSCGCMESYTFGNR